MTRVLFLSPAAGLGGSERSLLDLLACLDRDRYAPAVVALESGPLEAAVRRLDVPVTAVPLPAALSTTGDPIGPLRLVPVLPSVLGYYPRLRRVVAAHRPDIVHANGIKANLLASLLARPPVRLVWHVRDYVGARAGSARLLRWRAGACDLALCNSRSVETDFRSVCPGVATLTVYNAVAVPDTVAPPPAMPRRVCLVATYGRWKGHRLFLDAVARRAAVFRRRGLRFGIIGGAVYRARGSQVSRAELAAAAAAHAIEDLVEFHDFEADLDRLYAHVDVLVNASVEPEPFGRTLIEGMAYGKRVIAPAAGGPLEILDDGVTGFLFTPGDADALAAAIDRAVDHPDGSALVAGARRAVRERFSHAALRERMADAYGRLTA